MKISKAIKTVKRRIGYLKLSISQNLDGKQWDLQELEALQMLLEIIEGKLPIPDNVPSQKQP